MANPAECHELTDKATQKLIDHPLVQQHIPAIRTLAAKARKAQRDCRGCGGRVRRGKNTRPDYNAVREAVANLPPGKKAQLKKLMNTKQLVVPYVRKSDNRRVKLKF